MKVSLIVRCPLEDLVRIKSKHELWFGVSPKEIEFIQLLNSGCTLFGHKRKAVVKINKDQISDRKRNRLLFLTITKT